VKFDESASILMRAIHLIAGYLGCEVHVHHSLRRSSKWEELVDGLSRKSTTTFKERSMVRDARRSIVRSRVSAWLENPVEDWNLPYVLLGEVKKKMKLG
jgi:hypothetical protein